MLENFDREQFLSQYWQRQPLLIKNALPGFKNPLTADELAGLAMEAEVESRIVQQSVQKNVQQSGTTWSLEHGPFAGTAFDRSEPWTLLVQAVDEYVESVASLWQIADFLPAWRRDDVMVSYATAGGGVGPHYDNYDVFLLQGMGQRSWRLGQWCSATDTLLPHDSLRILEDFSPSADYLLEPGDILYVPPRLAHWGEAVTECMTYSLGFRAPAVNGLVSRWVDHHLERMDPEQLYTDPPLQADCRPGEITAAAAQHALALIRAQLETQLQELGQDMQWLGELVTEPRTPIEPVDPEERVPHAQVFHMESAARLAWAMDPPAANTHEEGGATSTALPVSVYANGESLRASAACLPVLQALSRQRSVSRKYLHTLAGETDMLKLLAELEKVGCVYGE